MDITDPDLLKLRAELPDAAWEARLEAARADAEKMAIVAKEVSRGRAALHAVQEQFPDRNAVHMVRRFRMYESGGAQALVSRRFVKRPSRVTPAVQAAVRSALAAQPQLRSGQLCEIVKSSLGAHVPPSTMRQWLRSQGLAQPAGRPAGAGSPSRELPTVSLPNAGAELFKAVDEHLGATRALTNALTAALGELPAPEGEVRDDRAGRDDVGRFTAAYNAPEERDDPDLAPRFASVEQKRKHKDLPAMRAAKSSAMSRHRKDRALVYLPIVVEGARWSELQHWRGQQLETLVGHAFQPSTLDKYARELKYAGVSDALQRAVVSFWARQGPQYTGAIILYCDTFTKPIWTRYYSLSTRVSRTGRIQPANSTMFLHRGGGTAMLYESHSGKASMPKHVVAMLQEWESVAGVGTARRLVVMDREGHAASLLRELDQAGWWYLLPVRRSSARSTSRWEGVGDWSPLDPEQPEGPELREAFLWLKDSKARGASPKEVRVRAITRRAGPSDEGATWVTNAPADAFTARELLDLYGTRWVNQEHAFRDANGRVGLGRHHGYGKQKIDHVAVIDQREKLEAQARRAREQRAQLLPRLESLSEARAVQQRAVERVRDRIAELQEKLKKQIGAGAATADLQETHHILTQWQSWLGPATTKLDELREEHRTVEREADRLLERASTKEALHEELSGRTEIYTVDVELDEIMTAFKITFVNVAGTLMRDHMGVRWQLDHLIRAVLTLPGQLRRTPQLEIIEIFRQERDPDAMAAVERACESLNALGLRREGRRVQFALISTP